VRRLTYSCCAPRQQCREHFDVGDNSGELIVAEFGKMSSLTSRLLGKIEATHPQIHVRPFARTSQSPLCHPRTSPHIVRQNARQVVGASLWATATSDPASPR